MNLDVPIEDSEYIQISNPNNFSQESTNQDSGSKPQSHSSLFDGDNLTNFICSPKLKQTLTINIP